MWAHSLILRSFRLWRQLNDAPHEANNGRLYAYCTFFILQFMYIYKTCMYACSYYNNISRVGSQLCQKWIEKIRWKVFILATFILLPDCLRLSLMPSVDNMHILMYVCNIICVRSCSEEKESCTWIHKWKIPMWKFV